MSPSIAFHCCQDESRLWRRGFENQGTANPFLPPLPSLQRRQALPGAEGTPALPPLTRVGTRARAPCVFVKQSF